MSEKSPGLGPLTVVIPARNAEKFLTETILSVLDQTTPPESIVVINDGSTDDTFRVAARLSSRGVLVVTQEASDIPGSKSRSGHDEDAIHRISGR